MDGGLRAPRFRCWARPMGASGEPEKYLKAATAAAAKTLVKQGSRQLRRLARGPTGGDFGWFRALKQCF